LFFDIHLYQDRAFGKKQNSRRALMDKETLLTLTADIVAAHVGNNKTAPDTLSGMIHSVYNALATAGIVADKPEPALVPAVPVRSSVKPGTIACLECGQRMSVLKRHLSATHGLSAQEYKARWDLPASYPLVAPDYALKRKDLAHKIRLGRKPASS
jgi:predicted transcriptional regulator